MGLLADLYSYGDGLKRKANGLLQDPMGTASLGATRMAEDQRGLLNLMDQAGYTPGSKSVLQRPQDQQQARNALADQAMQSYGGLLGATVWHGSPHKFDKFDSSKIGTGEGAQAQGHGLYMADAEDAASSYLAGKPGYVYKADLPDDAIAKMLNWDAGPSGQPKEVIEGLKKIGIEDWKNGADLYWKLKRTKFGVKESMAASKSKEAQAYASETLRAAGVPGIRYLDGISRTTGQGTSNYVVFPGNESLLQILERNGQAIK